MHCFIHVHVAQDLVFLLMKVHAQGLINLADNRPEDGGLVVVPGFHKIFPQWTEHTRNTLGKQYSNKMVSLYRYVWLLSQNNL